MAAMKYDRYNNVFDVFFLFIILPYIYIYI